jgi:hypothetical protein
VNNKVVPLLVTLIVLVAINIAVTTFVALRPASAPVSTGALVDEPIVSEERVAPLVTKMITSYNAKDVDGVYALLDDLAKAQISRKQLTTQIDKLHAVLGKVGTSAYDRAELAGKDAGRTFYTINYKVALSGGSFDHGTLKLTVVRRGEDLRMVGFFINGSDTVTNQQP